MANVRTTTSLPPVLATQPADADAHRKRMQQRQAEIDKKRTKMLRCLDPLYAAELERRKPVYEWRVQCKIFRSARGTQRAGSQDYDEQVVAKTEDGAWALFCDKIGEYPSRRNTQPIITRLQKRSVESEDE